MRRAPTLLLALATGVAAQELPAMHGPILSWHDAPGTSMTVTWVERTARPEPGTWRRGPAGFGFGDDDDATLLDAMRGVHRSFVARIRFEEAAVPAAGVLGLAVRYDDGFVAYLNGTEVQRVGFEEGGVVGHEAGDEPQWFPLPGARALLRPGWNLLAMEGHNTTVYSMDLTLDPALEVRDADGVVVASPVAAGSEWEYMADGYPPPGWARGDDTPAPPLTPWPQPGSPDSRRIWFRESGAEVWTSAEAGARPFALTRDSVRSAVLTDLEPDTTYAVTVAPGAPTRATTTFRTAPVALDGPLTFVTGGDMYGSRAAMEAMNRRAGAEDALFALLGGDLAYANGVAHKRWYDWLDSWFLHARTPGDRLIPMVVAIGNHEVRGGFAMVKKEVQAPYFYSLFTLDRGLPYYALDFGQYLSIVVLDSGHTTPTAGPQAQWLERALMERAARPHLVAVYHKPAYGTAKAPHQGVRRDWVPLFDRFGLDVAFENDHHTYKRTHLLRGGAVHEDGVLYLGDGAWGVLPRAVPDPAEVDYLAAARGVNHLIRVTLAGGERSYVALTAHGEEIDRWPESADH